MTLKIPGYFAKPVLYLTNFFNDNKVILVCKGYDNDFDNYTGLYWDEDKDTDFSCDIYEDFQIWIF
jgi:hypothetical protein